MDESAASQVAIGNYIAQADRGGVATVSVYEVAAPPPPDEAAVAEAAQLLAELPSSAPPDPAPLPYRSRMPLPRNPLFTGRSQELLWLARRLGASTEQVPTVALVGLGGVGKSQLASEYVHRYGRYYAGGVYWVNFADGSTVDTEVASCGGPEGLQLRPDFLQLSVMEQVRLVKAAWQGPLPRLLVFDNCEDESILSQWRPPSGGCRVLVTSRRLSWDPALGVEVSELDVMPRSDAVALLARYRKAESQVDGDALEEIVEELGQLPLAVHLAGSYLGRYRRVVTPAAYLEQLRTSSPIDHRSLTAAGISPTEHIQSIAATFALSVDKLAEDQEGDELAGQCLVAASYLASGTPIPRAVLRAILGFLDSPDEDLRLEDALLRLAELGLIHLGIDGDPRLHRLVIAFVEERLGSPSAQEYVELAMYDLVSRRYLADSDLVRATYEPHLRMVTDRAIPRDDENAAALSNLFGLLLKRRDDDAGAVLYTERALHIKERIFGVDSPETAKDLNDLGYSYLGSSRRMLGLPYLERARRLWNPETDALNLAATLDNIGQLNIGAEQIDLAGPFFEEAYEIRTRELGEDNYSTSVTLLNLGQIAWHRGDLSDACELYERVVRIRESLVGQIDPSQTAWSHNALAAALRSAGDVAGAAAHLKKAVDLYREALGPTHPRTVAAAAIAASYAVERGDPSGATDLLEASGALREVIANVHAETFLKSFELNNLGFAFWLSGNYAEAHTLYEVALERGGTNSTTLNNLGMIEERLGRYDKAVDFYNESLAQMRDETLSYGSSSLRARVLNNLGVSLALGGKPGEAEERLADALAIRCDLEGVNGLDYAVTLRNLGLVAQKRGLFGAARRLMERSRDILAPKESSPTPEYARTMHCLGELLATKGDNESAVAALQAAQEVRRSILGLGHPDRAVTLRALANVLFRIGREPEACDAIVTALPIFERCMGPDHPWTLEVRAQAARCSTCTSVLDD